MSEKDLFVGNSQIQGKGLFTKKAVKKGHRVFILKGEKKRKINKTIEDVFSNPNWVGFNKNWWTDPRSPYKYLNHSCNPNTGIKGAVCFYALRDIGENEELTFDYTTSEVDTRWHLNCSCGAKNCRKKITSIQFLNKKIFDSYKPYIPTGIMKIYLEYKKNDKTK